jgi:4-hydroxybenzoate polyprenyltransferase
VKALDLVFFVRPMLLVPVWTIYLHYLAVCSKSGYGLIIPSGEALAALGSLTLVFAGGYVLNQIFDVETDRRNNKLFFLPRGILSPGAAWRWYIALTAAGLMLAPVSRLQTVVPVLLIVLLGVLYSAPPLRLKDHPVGGLIANAVAYGFLIPWTAEPFCAGQPSPLAPAAYFLAVATGYILTTIPDYDGDAAAGKRTIAVVISPRGAVWLALLTSAATGAVSFLTGNVELMLITAVTVACCGWLMRQFSRRLVMITITLSILLLTLLAAVHFWLYGAFLLLTVFLTRVYYKHRFGMVYPRLW